MSELGNQDESITVDGCYRWGVAIPEKGKSILIVCPRCAHRGVRSYRVSDFAAGYVYAHHDACGWGDYRTITPEWRAQWEALSPDPPIELV